jgi:phosphoribosyl-ATP pyrophosphohydrolase
MNGPHHVFGRLMATIDQRKSNPSNRSYTTALMTSGVDGIGAKVMEEAAELVEAARAASRAHGRPHVIHEAADLIYHLLVLLSHCDVELSEVEAELARRFGGSGFQEKAARHGPHSPP